MKSVLYRTLALLLFGLFWTEELQAIDPYAGKILFVENKGQWPEQVKFAADFPGGKVFFEEAGLSYVFHNATHEHHHNEPHHTVSSAKSSIKIQFRNSTKPVIQGANRFTTKFNYYLGSDSSKWAANCATFEYVTYDHIYPGIDMKFYVDRGRLKYDLILSEHADPSKIQFEYIGQRNMHLEDGCIFLDTGIGSITENRPIAFQNQKQIDCQYELEGNRMSFEFPNGYDKTQALTIDPELIFSTFSGSTADNFGFTACFDEEGNLYSGGVVFGLNFITTTGVSYGGGVTDMLILKYDSAGSRLIYGTYIGGSSEDTPHSLVVNNSNELLIMGTTGSADYPVSFNGYDRSFNGGASLQLWSSLPNGSDIVVTKLNMDGRVDASTFIGGSGNDGILPLVSIGNYNTQLVQNYGDYQRGDIIMDDDDNVYIASFSDSQDFPVTSSVGSQFAGGLSDGLVFSLNSNLSTLRWSAYLGGQGDDAAYSIKLGENNKVLVGGGTRSSNFPATPNTINPSFRGFIDGYVTIIDQVGDSIMQSTYLGTQAFDQAYFIDIDDDQNVYVTGQTRGLYPSTPGTFNVTQGGQFIHKMSPELDSTIFSLTFGSGGLEPNISPTAFLASECQNIFLSGWGGIVNNTNSPNAGNTNGMPITSDALFPTTDGSDFYLMVLTADGSELLYGSYYGSTDLQNGDHVDGGTSRFDKRGIVYQSVCSCGGLDDNFPTTPGAWSQFNLGVNANGLDRCNNAAFKFDLASIDARFEANVTEGCVPLTVEFQNNSVGGVENFWDFGQGFSLRNEEIVTHTFDEPGDYQVTLRVVDENTCQGEDSQSLQISVVDAEIGISGPVRICDGASTTLIATGGIRYEWEPAETLDDPFSASPMASPSETTEYTVSIVSPEGCIGYASVLVTVAPDPIFEAQVDVSPPVETCQGVAVQLFASGGASYQWSPDEGLNNPRISNPIATPIETTEYVVTVTSAESCKKDTSVQVTVIPFFQEDFFADRIESCIDAPSYVFTNNNADLFDFTWDFGDGTTSTDENPVHRYQELGSYQVTVNTDAPCVTERVVEIDHQEFFVPNVFTPNGDGLNETFEVRSQEHYPLRVYDRSGNLVYDSPAYTNDWTGDDLPTGTYFYQLLIPDEECRGWVQLLR